MISFLKSFLSGEKTAEEQAILSSIATQKKRDVITLDAYAMDEEEESGGNCSTGGCGGCACG